MEKISIIVPVYNVDAYLERCLDSIIKQSFSNLEIILIDDGSTDLSGDICDKYENMDKRVVVVHKKNEGVSVARNIGLSLAKGDYISFVDSDDVISYDMYDKLYNNIKKTNSDISVCNYMVFRDQPSFDRDGEISVFDKKDALIDIISDGVITSFLWNKLFKKEVLENIVFPSNKIYEDMYVMPSLIERINRLCFDNSRLYGYFKRDNSYVNTYNEKKNYNYLEFCDNCYFYLSKYDYLKSYLGNYRCFYIYSAFLQGAKSGCMEIFNSKYMDKYYKIFRNDFKLLNKKVSLKRKMLFYTLYINKNIFYKLVSFLS